MNERKGTREKDQEKRNERIGSKKETREKEQEKRIKRKRIERKG